jgi:hypothetical protein
MIIVDLGYKEAGVVHFAALMSAPSYEQVSPNCWHGKNNYVGTPKK